MAAPGSAKEKMTQFLSLTKKSTFWEIDKYYPHANQPNSAIAGDFNFGEEYFWGQHEWAKLRLQSTTWQSEGRLPKALKLV